MSTIVDLQQAELEISMRFGDIVNRVEAEFMEPVLMAQAVKKVLKLGAGAPGVDDRAIVNAVKASQMFRGGSNVPNQADAQGPAFQPAGGPVYRDPTAGGAWGDGGLPVSGPAQPGGWGQGEAPRYR